MGEVEVGFYSTAKYKDGTPLTNVALWQEFGTNGTNGVGKIPERPFFRIAIRKMEAPALALLKADVDPKTMVVTRRIAEKLGLHWSKGNPPVYRQPQDAAECRHYHSRRCV